MYMLPRFRDRHSNHVGLQHDGMTEQEWISNFLMIGDDGASVSAESLHPNVCSSREYGTFRILEE